MHRHEQLLDLLQHHLHTVEVMTVHLVARASGLSDGPAEEGAVVLRMLSGALDRLDLKRVYANYGVDRGKAMCVFIPRRGA